MSILGNMKDSTNVGPLNSPTSSTNSSDSESPSEPENLLSSSEPDVSLDEMLSLACRQGKLDIVQLLLQSGAQVNHRNRAGNTPLLEACSQGHVSVANYLLDNGAKIDAPTETTLDSALTWACTLGNTPIVEALLEKNADVEHRTKDGCTALMFACLAGHRDVAEKLLNALSEINVESDSNKDSPLTFACWKGHYDVVELLLKRTANIEHRTKEGFSPLMFAALGGHTKVARKLLQCNSQVNVPSGSNNDIPLTSACWKGHHDVVQQLLEFHSNIEHRTKDGCTPLMLAAREGHFNVAELLLKNNSQVNVPSGSENNIPLTLACWKGHWEVVGLLLDYGSDIEHRNKAGCTPLMLAAREGHYKTTALLLDRNAQVNVPSGSNDDTPLTLACWKGHKDVVLLLLEHKSNIDHQTKTGCTPLMEATREGHRDVAEILLDHNADVELPDNYGQSPLFMACWKGHCEVAELLLQRNAYRDCRTKTGITPLFQACRENHVGIVELLLEYGAGVNTPFPNSRENPMTLCAEKGHTELIRLLLSKGAVHDCRTKKGCTPTYLACKEGHIEITQILAKVGTDMETPDCRGITPIMAAYKNGHVHIVDWLIRYVHHLPSDDLCHKILMSSVDDKDKELILQKRSKCLAILQETKKKRELLALKNAQNLVQELVDERNREEKKKKKKAEKRRDKQNKRKRTRENENLEVSNGINALENGDDEDNDDEDLKDNILPTENREHSDDEKPPISINDVIKISDGPKTPSAATVESCHDNGSDIITSLTSRHKKTRTKKLDRNNKQASEQASDKASSNGTTKYSDYTTKQRNKKNDKKISVSDFEELIPVTSGECNKVLVSGSADLSSKDTVHALRNCLAENKKQNININRPLLRTPGICTQGSSTSGPSRLTASSQTESSNVRKNVQHQQQQKQQQQASTTSISELTTTIPSISSVAVSTSSWVTTAQMDPRTQVKYNTPVECNGDLEEEAEEDGEFDTVGYARSDSNSIGSNSAGSNSSVSQNSSFDEYRESDWKELTRSGKLVLFELTVPNAYCGRVIGKGGKKINTITEESGAQITIDKPPLNVVPADRVITIKGSQSSAEKARHLVTKALNTPSLNYNQVNSNREPNSSKSSDSSHSNNNNSASASSSSSSHHSSSKEIPKNSQKSDTQAKKAPTSARPAVSVVDIPVTPLLSYSKVATGTISLNEIQKQLQSHMKLTDESNSNNNNITNINTNTNNNNNNNNNNNHNEKIIYEQNNQQPISSDSDSSSGNGSLKSSPLSKNHGLPTEGFGSKDFSYFTHNDAIRPPADQKPQMNIADQKKSSKDPLWNAPDVLTDRNRSTSWTGHPEAIFPNGPRAGNRSHSTEAINERQNVVTSPWNLGKHGQSADELSDEPVFIEENNHWTVKSKSETNAHVPNNMDGWEMSSSRTSSVSSSKVELANILDNDSGMGGSNPLGPTPTSIQSESQINFQDPPYIDTALENSPWLQNRGAYSAPSSPALQRGNEETTHNCSPNPQNIRPHPSMEELNSNRPWIKKSIYNNNTNKETPLPPTWRSRNASPSSCATPFQQHMGMKTGASPDQQDSGLSSPQTQADKRVRCPPDLVDPMSSAVAAVVSQQPSTWCAERFQDVHSVSDLLSQLSLMKYVSKFEDNGISLDTLINISEKDLQAFDIPKGPRLKILKACEVIENQRRIRQPAFPHPIEPTSQQTFFPSQPGLPVEQPGLFNNKPQHSQQQQQPLLSSGGFNYPGGFLGYPLQQPYNVILPPAQPFIHPPPPPVHQSHPAVQPTVFTACEEFPLSHPTVEHLQTNPNMMAPPPPPPPPHQFMYPDNPAFFFYQAQS